LPTRRYPETAQAVQFFTDLESRLEQESLVQYVGATELPPLSGYDGRRGVVIENREVGPDDGPTRAHPRIITTNYTKAIGATIRTGRGFLPDDTATSTPVVLVNET